MLVTVLFLSACGGTKDEPPQNGGTPESTMTETSDGLPDVQQNNDSAADSVIDYASAIPAGRTSVTPQRFGRDSRAVRAQMLLFGENGGWGWSNNGRIVGGAAMDFRAEFGFYGSLEEAEKDGFPEGFMPDDMQIANFLFMINPEEECGDAYAVTIADARIETVTGKTIELSGLNGYYGAQSGSVNLGQAAAEELQKLTVAELRPTEAGSAFFKARILVEFSETAVDLDLAEEAIAAGGYFLYGNTLTLRDFQYDGTLTVNSPIQLIIKGDCRIETLVLNEDTLVSRWAYGSLTCSHLEGAERILLDETCNSTGMSETGSAYIIAFDRNRIVTQGDRDEADGSYDFDWRDSNSQWQQDCLAAIAANRTAQVSLNIIDSDGTPVTDAFVTWKLANYDYKFSPGLDADEFLDPVTNEFPWWAYQARLSLSSNFGIAYSSLRWENFDNESSEYSFDYSERGNVAFLNASLENGRKIGIEIALHPLVYPSFDKLLEGNDNRVLYQRLAEYVLSAEFDGEVFNEMIKEHIAETVTAYADHINCFAVSNEPYYWTDFMWLIAGDITAEQIASWTAGEAATEAKMNALLRHIRELGLPDAAFQATIINGWAQEAKEAWVAAGKNPEELILFINDNCCMYNESEYETGHYAYYYEVVKELSLLPDNLITMVGLQMANESRHECSPTHLIDMMDAFDALGMKVIVTEFNYYVDHIEGTPLGGDSYKTTGCSSETEKELMYDYAYGMLLAAYAHTASFGFVSTGYPSGQAGFFYSCYEAAISPMGEAYSDLVDRLWYVRDGSDVSQEGTVDAGALPFGTYILTIDNGQGRYYAELHVDGSRTEYTIWLQP